MDSNQGLFGGPIGFLRVLLWAGGEGQGASFEVAPLDGSVTVGKVVSQFGSS